MIENTGDLDSQALFSEDGKHVYREGMIFECGDYPDKQFSLTEADADAYIQAYTPVEFAVEHDVPLPEKPLLESIRRAGNQIIGRAKLPVWLDKLVPVKKVSCSWNRDTKTLREISFTSRPRIASAALFSDNNPAVDPATTTKETNKTMTAKEWFDKAKALFTGEVPAEFSEGAAPATATDSEETKRLREQLESERKARITNEAASFADGAIAACKALPAEREHLVNAYVGAANTDAASPALFGDGKSSVSSLKAIVEARPVHKLIEGEVKIVPDDKGANFTRADDKKVNQEAVDPDTIAAMRKQLEIKEGK